MGLGLLLAACTASSETAAPDPDEPVPASTVDWSDLDRIDLGDGWSLVDGEGDAPVFEVHRSGTLTGIVELSSFDIRSLENVVDHLDAGEEAALSAYVEEFLAELEMDRYTGCGTEYRFSPEPVRHRDAADGPVVRLGFVTGHPGAPDSERVLQWAAIRGDALVLVNIAAYDPSSCVGTDGAELTLADLAEVEDLLAKVIESSDFSTIEPATRPER